MDKIKVFVADKAPIFVYGMAQILSGDQRVEVVGQANNGQDVIDRIETLNPDIVVVDAYLPRRVVEDLADIPNIVGLKDSSGNLTYTMEILEFAGDRINVLIGHDEVVLNGLAGGASGVILASAQVYPEVWQAILRAVQQGDL